MDNCNDFEAKKNLYILDPMQPIGRLDMGNTLKQKQPVCLFVVLFFNYYLVFITIHV